MSLVDKLFGKGNAFNTRLLVKKPAKTAAPKKTQPVQKAPKAKARLPKETTAVPMSRPGLSFGPDSTPKVVKAKRPAYSVTHDRDASYGPDDVVQPSGPSTRGKGMTKDAPFFPVTTGTNREALNDFKQSESRRSSDYSIGKENAPRVKKAIGKFVLGKGYSD